MKLLGLVFLVTLILFINSAESLSCQPCDQFDCGAPPDCGDLGTQPGLCGCCDRCKQAEGEQCGGDWGMFGVCAPGLTCFARPEDITWVKTGTCIRGI